MADFYIVEAFVVIGLSHSSCLKSYLTYLNIPHRVCSRHLGDLHNIYLKNQVVIQGFEFVIVTNLFFFFFITHMTNVGKLTLKM